MKAGFVSFLGRPNAGKSTLLNRIVGHKLAIVSDKPQTTRTRMIRRRLTLVISTVASSPSSTLSPIRGMWPSRARTTVPTVSARS